LGNGVTTFSNVSTPITTFAGGTDWKQVSCGDSHTAAIKTDGTLWTWGYSNDGAIGNGNNNTISTPITTFAGGTNWKQVCCGYSNVIALQDDGVNKQIFIWGRNYRKGFYDMTLGIKTVVVNQYQIDGNNWSIINSKGGSGVAAIKTDGTLWNWGTNGILGANDNVIRPTPITTFLGGTKWIDISSGRNVIAGITT
jgi:alpha-tubulin suppressor-like RCC1 family protein